MAQLHEYYRQVEAEVLNNSSNKLHQTWKKPFSQALCYLNVSVGRLLCTTNIVNTSNTQDIARYTSYFFSSSL